MVEFRIPLAGFRIPKRGFRIPQTKITWIPDSGLPYMWRQGSAFQNEKTPERVLKGFLEETLIDLESSCP